MDEHDLTGLDDPVLLARLVDISVTLNATLEPDRLLQSILTAAAGLLDCETASLLLYNERRGDLSFLSAAGPGVERLAEIPVPLEGSMAGWIFRTGQTLISNDVANDPRHYAKVGQQTGFLPRSLVGVPMRLRGKTTGVLEALNKRGTFDERDGRVLAVVASQAAVAVHNAQLVQELRRAHAELGRIDQVKSRFIALASHELRTPLAIITSYAEFLKNDAPGALSAQATRVLEAALRQRMIIDSMANLNLLQAGALDVRMEPLGLSPLVTDACADARPGAEAKRQRLDVALPAEAVEVRGDRRHLPVVLRNVLDNAIRFTPAGGTIRVEVTASPAEARVSVCDTGVGVPAGELENIFKDFYQVADHMTRRHGGLGLGLAIARGIMQLHGGRIWAESPGPDRGATFHVALPRHGAASEPHQ